MRDSASDRSATGPGAWPAPGRSLVPLPRGPHGSAGPGRCVPPSPVFLAQLIATAQGVPQMRARCRAAPEDASACYAAAAHSAAATPQPREWTL